jgi:hypothetical protein
MIDAADIVLDVTVIILITALMIIYSGKSE